jgi:hypothetical protein
MWCLLFSGSVSRMAHEVLHSPFIGYLNQKLSLFYGPVSALSPRISQIARHGFHVFVYPAFHDDDLVASENLEKNYLECMRSQTWSNFVHVLSSWRFALATIKEMRVCCLFIKSESVKQYVIRPSSLGVHGRDETLFS